MNQSIRILLPKINLIPELLQIVFHFYFDGPFILTYNHKTNSFITKMNSNFVLLNKANHFKIYNPPSFHFEEGDDDDYILSMLLIIKYPINLIHSNQDYQYSHESNLILEYIYKYKFDISSSLLLTYHCDIIIPIHYHDIYNDNFSFLQLLYNSNKDTRYKSRIQNLIYGFQIKSYATDVYIC